MIVGSFENWNTSAKNTSILSISNAGAVNFDLESKSFVLHTTMMMVLTIFHFLIPFLCLIYIFLALFSSEDVTICTQESSIPLLAYSMINCMMALLFYINWIRASDLDTVLLSKSRIVFLMYGFLSGGILLGKILANLACGQIKDQLSISTSQYLQTGHIALENIAVALYFCQYYTNVVKTELFTRPYSSIIKV